MWAVVTWDVTPWFLDCVMWLVTGVLPDGFFIGGENQLLLLSSFWLVIWGAKLASGGVISTGP